MGARPPPPLPPPFQIEVTKNDEKSTAHPYRTRIASRVWNPKRGRLRSFDEPRGDGVCNSKPYRDARTDANRGPYADSSPGDGASARRAQRLRGQ
jgi:hypothetical protein